jgi:RecB family endonuclease NucS
VRIIVADCSAVYSGRLNAMLPRATRVILVKADSSVLIFSELGSYKPLNWMAAPCTVHEYNPDSERWESLLRDVYVDDDVDDADCDADESAPDSSDNEANTSTDNRASSPSAEDLHTEGSSSQEATSVPIAFLRACANKGPDILTIAIYAVHSDQTFDLGVDPGLVKDGVEDHLQRFLAEQIERIGKGAQLVRREYPTAVGPVDIMAKDADGTHVAIEIKRHGGIDGVEQLTRYCKLLNRDPLLAPVRGIFAAQTITPQARVLATERGFECLILDYDDMKQQDSGDITLF